MKKLKSRLCVAAGILAIAAAVMCATGCKDLFDLAENEDNSEIDGRGKCDKYSATTAI